MKVIRFDKKNIVIDFTSNEIVFLNNAINETLGHLEEWEFHARTAFEVNEAETLLDEIHQSIAIMKKEA